MISSSGFYVRKFHAAYTKNHYSHWFIFRSTKINGFDAMLQSVCVCVYVQQCEFPCDYVVHSKNLYLITGKPKIRPFELNIINSVDDDV